jgi:hypothetical protein
MTPKTYEFGKYTIERVGQEVPSVGNNVVVRVTVTLPAKGSLIPELQFGQKLSICSEYLTSLWGRHNTLSDNVLTHRELSRCFTSSTWAQAELDADVFATNELDKLASAINARREALRKA